MTEVSAECRDCAWPETTLRVPGEAERIRDLVELAAAHARDTEHRVHLEVTGEQSERESFLEQMRLASDVP